MWEKKGQNEKKRKKSIFFRFFFGSFDFFCCCSAWSAAWKKKPKRKRIGLWFFGFLVPFFFNKKNWLALDVLAPTPPIKKNQKEKEIRPIYDTKSISKQIDIQTNNNLHLLDSIFGFYFLFFFWPVAWISKGRLFARGRPVAPFFFFSFFFFFFFFCL